MDIDPSLNNIVKQTEEPTTDNEVKYLVLGGGGIAGLPFYGSLKCLNKAGKWDIKNIKGIYATSVSTIIAVMICLNYDWNDLDDFIIKRPWHKVFKFDLTNIFNAIENRGIFNKNVFDSLLNPLLLGKELETTITMKEFYELTQIECYFMVTELNNMNLHIISHKTYPDWKLTDAVYCSCALPICFSPFLLNDKLYCDGGFVSNLPIKQCIEDNCNENEILIIGLSREMTKSFDTETYRQFNLFDFLLTLLYNLIQIANNIHNYNINKHVLFDATNSDFTQLYESISNPDFRSKLIQYGIDETDNLLRQHSI